MKYLNERQTTELVKQLTYFFDENEPSQQLAEQLIYGKQTSRKLMPKDDTLMRKAAGSTYHNWLNCNMERAALTAIVARYTAKESLAITYKGITLRFPWNAQFPSTSRKLKSLVNEVKVIERTKRKWAKYGHQTMTYDGSLDTAHMYNTEETEEA